MCVGVRKCPRAVRSAVSVHTHARACMHVCACLIEREGQKKMREEEKREERGNMSENERNPTHKNKKRDGEARDPWGEEKREE